MWLVVTAATVKRSISGKMFFAPCLGTDLFQQAPRMDKSHRKKSKHGAVWDIQVGKLFSSLVTSDRGWKWISSVIITSLRSWISAVDDVISLHLYVVGSTEHVLNCEKRHWGASWSVRTWSVLKVYCFKSNSSWTSTSLDSRNHAVNFQPTLFNNKQIVLDSGVKRARLLRSRFPPEKRFSLSNYRRV